jgi:hypothetical protein
MMDSRPSRRKVKKVTTARNPERLPNITTLNFYAPLRSVDMDIQSAREDEYEAE